MMSLLLSLRQSQLKSDQLLGDAKRRAADDLNRQATALRTEADDIERHIALVSKALDRRE